MAGCLVVRRPHEQHVAHVADVSVGGIGNMVLHSNGVDGVEFRFMADRNGTIATALMNTDRAAAEKAETRGQAAGVKPRTS